MILKYKRFKSHFLSKSFADDRFQRLNEKFSSPLLGPVMLSYSSAIYLLTHFNLLLQREEPTIHVLKSAMENLGKTLAKQIVTPEKLRDISSISDIDLESPDNFKDTKRFYVGTVTKNTLKKLPNEGDITVQQHKDFYDAAYYYYFKSLLAYIQGKFPLNDPVCCNASWVNVAERVHAESENVQFFYDLLPDLMNGISTDDLYEEFTDYQILHDDDITDEAWREVKVSGCLKKMLTMKIINIIIELIFFGGIFQNF